MGKKNTAKDNIVRLLSDGEFHSNVEICQVAGWRFGGHLFQMRERGFVFEKKAREFWERPTYLEYWKLVKRPMPFETMIVENGEVVSEKIVHPCDAPFLGDTNIPNPDYKPSFIKRIFGMR